LTDADAHPVGKELRKAPCRTAEYGHATPESEANGDHGLSREAVGEPRDWNAERCVEEAESRAGQETELDVGELKVVFDRLQQDREYLPVEKIDGVHQTKERRGVAEIRRAIEDSRRVAARETTATRARGREPVDRH